MVRKFLKIILERLEQSGLPEKIIELILNLLLDRLSPGPVVFAAGVPVIPGYTAEEVSQARSKAQELYSEFAGACGFCC